MTTTKTVIQEHYPTMDIDCAEKDIIQIWQKGKDEANVIQIERKNLPELIDILQKETIK